jgi:hypothetical protein
MDRNPNEDELKDLAQAIAQLRDDLASVNAAERALSERLRRLGGLAGDLAAVSPLDGDDGEDGGESKTTVDRIEAGLPGARRSVRPPEAFSTLKAGAVGAGLALGVVAVVLLAVNLGSSSRRLEAAVPTTAAATAMGPTTPVAPSDRDIPPPPPPAPPPQVEATASVPAIAVVAKPPPPPSEPAVSSAREATATTGGSGTLTVICTPKCDAIVDNGVTLVPSAVVNLPVVAGSHKLVLLGSNGGKKMMFVNVTPGQKSEVRVTIDAARDYGF